MYVDLHHQLRQYFGMYEYQLSKYFRELISKGDKCYDVGGQGGYDAIMFGNLAKSDILVFECLDEAIEELDEIISFNNYNISVIKGFVSDVDEGENITLDKIAEEHFYPDFIKIDIEGGEFNALMGSLKIIETKKPKMIIEVHGKDIEEQCIDLLKKSGYKIQIVNQPKLFSEMRKTFSHNRWLICRP